MKGISIFFLFLLFCIISRINGQCLTENDNLQSEGNYSPVRGKFRFSLNALKEASEIVPEGNLLFSPHSLYEALTLAYFGSRGSTESALRKTLQIPANVSKTDVANAYHKINNQNVVSPNYEYKSANRLYISSAKTPRKCMLDLFSKDLVKTNFAADPEAARTQINDWVSEITKGNIKDLIPADGIHSNTDLALVNAVFFKGLWKKPFDPAKSIDGNFYGSKQSKVTFMHQSGKFKYNYLNDLSAEVLELPYQGDEISTYFFLPVKITTSSSNEPSNEVNVDLLNEMINKMTKTTNGIKTLREVLYGGMYDITVALSIPRFTIEKELPVIELLGRIGAGDLVTLNANLTGFVENPEGVKLGDAAHKAKIMVNEEGTTAAAATVLFTGRSSPLMFNANHPFFYLLFNKKSESIIFAGIYRNPEE